MTNNSASPRAPEPHGHVNVVAAANASHVSGTGDRDELAAAKRRRVETEGQAAKEKAHKADDIAAPAAADVAGAAKQAPKKTIVVSSRRSALALYQTNAVIALLQEADAAKRVKNKTASGPPRGQHEKLHFELLETTTHGDEVQNRHLADLGSVGVFTKELEVQLLERQSRFAVHSLKDMPTRLPPGLVLGCITERGDERDCVLVHPRYLSASDAPVAAKDEGATATKDNGQNKKITSLHDLPATATIGSSSVRREALIRKHFPQMKVENIRGNLQTRIKKLEAADSPYDAIILAKVGLERLDLGQKIAFVLEEDEFPYAVSQGAYGVECREDDAEMKALLSEIKCVSSTYRCLAERALLASLDGGCQISMGVRTKFTAFKEGGNVAGKNQRKDLVEGGHEDEKNSSCATPADVAGELSIYAIVLSRDGADSVEAEEKFQIASEGDAATAGRSLGDRLRENGVARIWPNAGKEKRPITYGSAETAGLPSSGF